MRYAMLAARLAAGVWLLCIAAGAASAADAPAPPAPIHVQGGDLQGVADNGLAIYRGVPFAAPPTGPLRWRAPQPVPAWKGILPATAFKPACMQRGPTLPGMMETYSEDCLYLNVWAPTASGKLAVMVYLYGGGASSGSGSARLYWGDQLAKKGVIVVTFNYRVGALGFLAHPALTHEAGTSGNYGLRDIIAALRWTKANIAAFGGDPDNITLFGQSAGAYWESMLMVCPEAGGLFRRVIGASGGEFGTPARGDAFPDLAHAQAQGREYAQKLGAHSLQDLRALPAEQIVAQDAAMQDTGSVSALQPNIDGHLIPGPVRALYVKAKQAPVDLLVGSNADEGVNTLGPLQNATGYIADTQRRFGDFAGRVLALYPAGTDAEASASQLRQKSDETAWRAYSWASFQARAGTRNVYLYRFSSIPPFGQWPKLRAVGHGAELPYWFGFPPVALLAKYEAADRAALHAGIEDDIQTYWTNFAKTGNPNGAGRPDWPRFEAGSEKMLDMGDVFTVRDIANSPAFLLLNDLHQGQ